MSAMDGAKLWGKRMILLFCVLGIVFSISALFALGSLHIGILILFFLSSYIGGSVLFHYQIQGLASGLRKLLKMGLMVCCFVTIVFGGLTVMMLQAAYFNEPEYIDEEKTVIILGCKVEEDQPSLMLRHRLDAAYDYLVANDDANCIVSGGLGVDQTHTESEVMRSYLVSRGIDGSRIYEENQAKNTTENIQYSLALIDEVGLAQEIVLVTNDFHLYRAGLNVNEYHMEYEGIAGKTNLSILPSYWTREYIAVLRDIFLYS